MSAPISSEQQAATNIGAALMLGAAGVFIYCWSSFAGPFRWACDLQIALFGTYWEPPAVVLSAAIVAVAAAILSAIGSRILSAVPPHRSEWVVGAIIAVECAGLLLVAWQFVDAARHLPSPGDPVTVVDLATRGDAPLTAGHVRLIGLTPDNARVVTTDKTTRRRRTLWAAHEPVVARGDAVSQPVRIVADTHFAESRDGLGVIGDDPVGLLVPGGYGNRTLYRVRRAGMPLADDAAVLFIAAAPDPTDYYLVAGMIASPIILFLILYPGQRARDRRAARGRAGSSP